MAEDEDAKRDYAVHFQNNKQFNPKYQGGQQVFRAELRRKRTANGYSYNISVEGRRPTVLKRKKNFSYWYGKTEVKFNERVFSTFDVIPLRYDYEWDQWQMVHEYRQTEGGVSAPYVIVDCSTDAH